MKKNLLVLIVMGLLTLGKPSLGQQTSWVNPLPNGYDILDIDFVDPQVGLFCGTGGSLFRTTDGGSTLIPISIPTEDTLLQIVWLNLFDVVVASIHNLYISHDMGLSFSALCDIYPQRFIKVVFPSTDVGYALIKNPSGDTAFARSLDGGGSWSILHQPVSWNDVDASSTSEIMVIENLHILKSTDAGISFTSVYDETNSRIWKNIIYAGNNTWLAAGNNEYNEVRILRSTDHGATWSLNYLDYYEKIKHFKKNLWGELVYVFGSVSGWAYRPQIIYSSDQGQTWKTDIIQGWIQSSYNNDPQILAAFYQDENHAFAYSWNNCTDPEPDLGRMNTLLQKSGTNFEPYKTNFFRSILNMEWDGDNILQVNSTSLLRSTDNGITWTPTFPNTEGIFFEKVIKIPQTSSIFILGKSHDYDKSKIGSEKRTNIFYSFNDGNSWIKIISGMQFSATELYAFGSGEAYMFGRREFVLWKKNTQYYEKILGKAQLYRSIDMGITWTELSIPLDTMANAHFINADTGFIFGGGGSTTHGGYYLSTDQGNHWTYSSLGLPPIAMGFMLNSSVGFVATQEQPAHIYRFFTDNNQPELVFTADSTDSIADFAFSSTQTGWVLCKTGETGKLYYTQDGGQTWYFAGKYPYINKLILSSELNGFAYGTAGRLIKLGQGNAVAMPELRLAENYSLKIQPNPASRVLHILPPEGCIPGKVKISVFEATGKLFKSQEINHTSKQPIALDVSYLNTGIYFLSLQYGSKIYYGKFIVER
ncbi:MAG: T9SS type A sorting domain-containing protein [Bacteroidales bacterium]